jgi:transcriptional regulator with XRE-family HTH domain
MKSEELKGILEAKGIKQSFIVKKLQVSKGLVSRWVSGSLAIPEKHVDNLKAILR